MCVYKYMYVSCLLDSPLSFVFFQGSALVGTEEAEVAGEEEVEEDSVIEDEEDSEEEEVRL